MLKTSNFLFDKNYRLKVWLFLFEDLNNGPTGPAGADGTDGIDGETPVITIGTVTTGEPGSAAEATITGTAPNFVLNLTIPQGPTGPAA